MEWAWPACPDQWKIAFTYLWDLPQNDHEIWDQGLVKLSSNFRRRARLIFCEKLAAIDTVRYVLFDSLRQASWSLPQTTSFWVSFPDARNHPQFEISRSCASCLSSLGPVGHWLKKRRLEHPSQCRHGSSRLEQLGVMTATREIRAYASKQKQ